MTDSQERPVIVDYLAFSAPLSVMKDVHTFQEKGFEWRKFQYLPAYKHYQNSDVYACSEGYEGLPEFGSSNLTEEQKSQYEVDLYSCYHARLRMWIAAVFGLVVGVPRGKGGFAYQDSAVLYSDGGGNDHMGLLYWGGNKDTFYVQISGQGCAHVFSGTTCQKIHKWFKHLDITRLKRLDLATDDYDGIFTCEAARIAYQDEAFYGGKGPKPKIEISQAMDSDGCPTKEVVNVGSRQSRVYWRIYNKALEQKVSGIWYRSEVELKEISIDVLLNISGIYVGLCDYAAQINVSQPVSIPKLFGRKAVDAIEAKVKWLRNQASSTIAKVFHFFNGDIETVLSMIVREEHIQDMNLCFDIPPIYQTLLNEKLQTSQCPF
ncbi:replication initiation factor domain-containing protein [Photorhabdus sp. RW14-46]|uniref:replication initiation factor domain-containing protein n=1 Tax=Photorhabdus sp. RW14-46 TaxID=2100168 RepID=UPI0013F3E22F|nr:replication initiation factor domain-containing protein [Photorhabdus sp. RW14-46]NHB63721.1 replication initiation protein [Photorhabdus sp. RW14-46]